MRRGYIGFFSLFLVFPSFIQCAALLLDFDKVHIDVKMQQNSNSRSEIVKTSEIGIIEAVEFMNPKVLEAVEQALFVFCYHARLKNVTPVDVCHPVVQVSGAADQDVEDSFLELMSCL